MKIAVISDIHGNLSALLKVLEDIEVKRVDTIICLGDLVGYGPFPNEVVETIRSRNILCIKGNYDASVVENKFSFIRDNEINKFTMPWTNNELKEENIQYLSSLPLDISLSFYDKRISFVHGSPRKINEYIIEGSKEAEEIIRAFSGDILVCAHTHVAFVSQYGNKTILNDGSVGKSKIGRPSSTYALIEIYIDTEDNEIKHKESIVEIPYETVNLMANMRARDFPDKLVEAFIKGNE